MKLGFLDSIFNYADPYEAAVKVFDAKIPGVTLERMTVPHLLKIPLFSKLLMKNGSDAVIVFLTMLPEDSAELDLVHEKIIDLELDELKPVYFCIISADEFSDEEGLAQIMAPRLGLIAEAIAKIQASPNSLSGDIANMDLTNAMSMFSSDAEPAQASPTDITSPDPSATADLGDLNDDSGKSLF